MVIYLSKQYTVKKKLNSAKFLYLAAFIGLSFLMLYTGYRFVVPTAHHILFSTFNLNAVIESIWPYLLFMFLCAAGANYSWNMFNRASVINYSYEVTKEALERLPDSFTVLHDLTIGEAQIEHIIISDNAVFVIINRSVRGVVHINEQSGDWEIEKTGRGGTAYTSSLRNPLKEMRWKIHQVASFLKERGCKGVWVDGCVFFSNSDVQLEGWSEKVFDSQNGMMSYITSYEPKRPPRHSDINYAKQLLTNCL